MTVTGVYTDLVVNVGATGASDSVAIDTANPTATVDIADATLNDTDNSSLVTITFSEAVTGFDASRRDGGRRHALSGLSPAAIGGVTWTATFTATTITTAPAR